MKFDDPARLDWTQHSQAAAQGPANPRHERPAASTLCHNLLRSALSPSGYDKAVKIMSLENNLREGEKNLNTGWARDPERYFLTIFGQPAATGTWGWSFEGHHLSLNFVVRDGAGGQRHAQLLGRQSGHGAHLRARRARGGNPHAGRRRAIGLRPGGPVERQPACQGDDRRHGAGRVSRRRHPAAAAHGSRGIAGRRDDRARKENAPHAVGNLRQPSGAARWRRPNWPTSTPKNFDRVYFAWAGARPSPARDITTASRGRRSCWSWSTIQSDPAGNPANHIHSVWRSLEGDFGVAAN